MDKQQFEYNHAVINFDHNFFLFLMMQSDDQSIQNITTVDQ